MNRILVTGATSLIGHYLLPRLVQFNDIAITAVSRQNQPTDHSKDRLSWLALDIADASTNAELIEQHDALLHLAPLWTLPPWLERCTEPGIRRLIAFSSTSRITKSASTNRYERDIAQSLADAEDRLAAWADRHRVAWTVFRPTLVYGAGRDKNVAEIARFIRRFGFFPVIGAARGIRMPVHAEDLADACLLALNNAFSYGRAYNLPGGERLSYRAMVERIFEGLGKRQHVLSLPRGLLRSAIRASALLPRAKQWTPEMADRMALDLVFDCNDARQDFGFNPRAFHPHREDLLAQ